MWAVFRIVEEFTNYVRRDLWKEHQDAEDLDYMLGIGMPERYSVNRHEWRRGMVAKHDLMLRVCEVRENPSAFSAYAGEFAAWFSEMWDCSAEAAEGQYRQQDPRLRML